jgi:hypothetical protein
LSSVALHALVTLTTIPIRITGKALALAVDDFTPIGATAILRDTGRTINENAVVTEERNVTWTTCTACGVSTGTVWFNRRASAGSCGRNTIVLRVFSEDELTSRQLNRNKKEENGPKHRPFYSVAFSSQRPETLQFCPSIQSSVVRQATH